MKQGKHFKRLWGLMLLLIAMLMPQGVWAISGSGTSSSPYLIANEADLRTFQQYVEDGNSGIYGKLTADITLTSAWTRIGRADRKFTGYFDGQGHTISGMNLSFTAYEHGFFGFVNNATIKNFTLTGTMTSSANGNHSHGTVVGSAAGTTVIENVTSSVNLTLNHTGFTCIGGIVGHMDESSKVIGCTYTGTINLNKDSEQVGGIVGYAQRDLYITDNVFSGTITSTGKCKYLAGIAGHTDGTIEVSGCTNIGTINSGLSFDCVAGIVGYVQYQSRALITNCYFGGSLSSTSSGTSLVMGGILGAVNDEKGGNFRGLTYCFSDGTLTATSSSSTQIGGIAGVVKHKAVSMVTNNTYLSGKASRISAIDGSLSFDSSNKAITISVSAGTGGSVEKSYVYPTSTTATQLKVEATPNSGYHYVEWSDNGAQTHNVSLANNVSLTANFGAHTYGNWTTDVAATCTSDGTKHHNCSVCNVREDGTIPAKGHSLTATVATNATCTTAGNNKYWTCSTCKKVFSDEKATTETTVAAQTIAALGHGTTGYTDSYVWTGNAYNDWYQDTKACIFTLTCNKCRMKVVNGASLTCIRTAHVDATCTATGSTTYQATGSYTAANSNYNYSATKTNVYTVAALGHGYGAGAWSWEDDGHTATCTRTCSHDANHTSSKSVTLGNGITSAQQVAPTCGELGTTRYTATATVENVEYRDTKDIKDIPATGLHTFDDVTDPHHTLCTVCGHSFFRYTSSTGKAVDPYSKSALKDASGTKLDYTNTYADGKGVMEFNGTLKTIGTDAFWRCSNFTGDLIIPESVTSIGEEAFSECSGFTGNLSIPNSVTSIGNKAFYTCAGLKGNLTIPNSVTSIGKYTFCYCSGFTGNLTIPNSVTRIELSAFEGCTGFNGNLTIPNSVISIGNGAFYACESFTGVEFLSVPQIGSQVFSYVNCTKTVVLSDNSYVYKESNPYFPGVASVTAPCTLDLTGSVVENHANLTRNHNYTNNTLTPIEDGLYAYACDNGCGTHTDDHIIKDFNGAGNHLELTKSGSAYSTSEDITLADGASFSSPVDFTANSVTYTRTGIRNQWGTIVVPFDVNGSGDDYDLYKLDQVYDFELTLTKVNGTLAAGTPALIRLHDDLDGDYSLTLTASNTTVSGQLNDGSEANGLQLVGTYETQELNDYDYFLSNNKFWSVGEMLYHGAMGVGAAPFRAYLRSTIAGSNARELSIKVEEGTLTAIEALDAITEGDAEYYDMNGRRINSLQKGVNIVKYGNGKTIKVNIK